MPEPSTPEAINLAGRRIATLLRTEVQKASDQYEMLTGKIVTRVEVYRQGQDWIINMEVADLPAAMREDKFG